jgi:hypothetical protein
MELPDFPLKRGPANRAATWLALINSQRLEPLQSMYLLSAVADQTDTAVFRYAPLLQKPNDDPVFEQRIQKQIELDAPRTFTRNQFIQSTQGQGSLSRLLLALARQLPFIGYCQVTR